MNVDRPNAGLCAVAKASSATSVREEIALHRGIDGGYSRLRRSPTISPLAAMASSGLMVDAAYDLYDAGGPGVRRRKKRLDAALRLATARATLYGPTSRSSVVTM